MDLNGKLAAAALIALATTATPTLVLANEATYEACIATIPDAALEPLDEKARKAFIKKQCGSHLSMTERVERKARGIAEWSKNTYVKGKEIVVATVETGKQIKETVEETKETTDIWNDRVNLYADSWQWLPTNKWVLLAWGSLIALLGAYLLRHPKRWLYLILGTLGALMALHGFELWRPEWPKAIALVATAATAIWAFRSREWWYGLRDAWQKGGKEGAWTFINKDDHSPPPPKPAPDPPEDDDPPPSPAPAATKQCRKCKAPLKKGQRACTECGRPAPGFAKCPACKKVVKKSKCCAECGAPLATPKPAAP